VRGGAPLTAWRCFPWDERAAPTAPFGAAYIPPGQTVGRFDLHDRPPVRYLAESPEHALGEVLAPFRGTEFRGSYLRQGGQPLALVEMTLSPALLSRVADCTDPAVLNELHIYPDHLAHHDRAITQRIARRLYERREMAGLRWWSALTGAWHTLVLFTDRVPRAALEAGAPRVLEPGEPALARALSMLGIRVR
jgi:hypothetical protein